MPTVSSWVHDKVNFCRESLRCESGRLVELLRCGSSNTHGDEVSGFTQLP